MENQRVRLIIHMMCKKWCVNMKCVFLSLLLCLVQLTSSAEKPNVIIFYTDDQGTLDANCFGSSDLYTPHIDSLAKNGVTFTQAYAHTVCCPSRAMLMTGRYPQRSDVVTWGKSMLKEEYTIAELLKDKGYKTALIGKWHLGMEIEYGPESQGFETFYGHRGGFIDNYVHFHLHKEGKHDLWDGRKEIFEKGKYYPDLMTAKALKYIEDNKNDPFFLYLAYNLPHYPEQYDPKFESKYEGMSQPRKTYAMTISTVDDLIGKVLTKLEETGIKDNTILIFMSDNGHSEEDYKIKMDGHTSGLPKGTNYGPNAGGGNTGKWIGKKTNFLEGGIRVPAIISYPKKFSSGIKRSQIITAMDWFPTIAELCGIQQYKNKIDGYSLVPIIQENALSNYKTLHYQWKKDWMVREGEWKLLGKSTKALKLLNLNDTLPERKNYFDEKPEVVNNLHRKYKSWIKEVSLE